MVIGEVETRVWCSEKGKEDEADMDLWARRRAAVLLIVRRWWGRMSALSSDGSESTSERAMSSSSSSSEASRSSEVGSFPLVTCVGAKGSSAASLSVSLSLSSIREVSILY